MVLSDSDILSRIDSKELVISPMVSNADIGSYTIDLRLGDHFRIFRSTSQPFIDIGDGDSAYAMSDRLMEDVYVGDSEAFYLHPSQLALGITQESISIPDDLAGFLDGRSSLGRLGVTVHVTAHTIDAGFQGKITLELVNVGPFPLALRPGIRICSIGFQTLTSPTTRPYYSKNNAKYHRQNTPIQSRISKDSFE